MAPTLYWILLLACCGYAMWQGRREERTVALICLVATIASLWALPPIAQRYVGLETGVLIVDVAVLAGFLAVALKSDRFWPLWVTGFHLTGGLAHFFKGVDVGLLPQAYAAAARFWAYPILIVLAVGTWREHRRRRQSDSFSGRPA